MLVLLQKKPCVNAADLLQRVACSFGGDTRDLNGYHVYRLNPGQEENPGMWSQLTANPIGGTSYTDTGFGSLGAGDYKWAIKAVYTAGVLSNPAFSNQLEKAVGAPLPPELVITKSAHNAILNWEHVNDASGAIISGIQYKIYRHTAPEIPSTPACLIGTTADNSFVDTNALQDHSSLFYLVIAISP
jgi:hypothetical protein